MSINDKLDRKLQYSNMNNSVCNSNRKETEYSNSNILFNVIPTIPSHCDEYSRCSAYQNFVCCRDILPLSSSSREKRFHFCCRPNAPCVSATVDWASRRGNLDLLHHQRNLPHHLSHLVRNLHKITTICCQNFAVVLTWVATEYMSTFHICCSWSRGLRPKV